jgi:hypothetical protein
MPARRNSSRFALPAASSGGVSSSTGRSGDGEPPEKRQRVPPLRRDATALNQDMLNDEQDDSQRAEMYEEERQRNRESVTREKRRKQFIELVEYVHHSAVLPR